MQGSTVPILMNGIIPPFYLPYIYLEMVKSSQEVLAVLKTQVRRQQIVFLLFPKMKFMKFVIYVF